MGTTAAVESSRTIRAAVQRLPAANLALISVPGDFAVAEARKAMELGLHVMIFSDNVPIEDEAALKREARERRLFVMGPDCGTAIIGGVPLGFANVVPRGDIGIIGASGTGIQEVSCLIARAGRGISHAIGTGGRDLKAEVGAITTLMAIDALDADDRTKHVVLISKPPAASVARSVLDRVAKSAKPFTICFLGASDFELPANARSAATLKATAEIVLGGSAASSAKPPLRRLDGGKLVRGLFAGGTLCSEAQIIFRQAGLAVMSNVPVPGASAMAGAHDGHVMIDLGDDEFTRGRPHPMFEPGVRDAPLAEALADPEGGTHSARCRPRLWRPSRPGGPSGRVSCRAGPPPAHRGICHRHRCGPAAARRAGPEACRGWRDRRGLQRGRDRSRDCGARRRLIHGPPMTRDDGGTQSWGLPALDSGAAGSLRRCCFRSCDAGVPRGTVEVYLGVGGLLEGPNQSMLAPSGADYENFHEVPLRFSLLHNTGGFREIRQRNVDRVGRLLDY